MNGNDVMTWVLRSPFHGLLSGGMMLITVRGRKTGNAYTLPVEYFEDQGFLWVVSKKNRTWWKNLQGGVAVGLLLRRTPMQGWAELQLDEPGVRERLSAYLRHAPMSARSMGVRLENKIPNADDLARAAQNLLFVRIALSK